MTTTETFILMSNNTSAQIPVVNALTTTSGNTSTNYDTSTTNSKLTTPLITTSDNNSLTTWTTATTATTTATLTTVTMIIHAVKAPTVITDWIPQGMCYTWCIYTTVTIPCTSRFKIFQCLYYVHIHSHADSIPVMMGIMFTFVVLFLIFVSTSTGYYCIHKNTTVRKKVCRWR